MKIDNAMKIDNSVKAMERRNRAALKNALLDGEYVLERQTCFYLKRDLNDCLMAPIEIFERGTKCQTLRFTGRALFVCVMDMKQRTWYAWIHA